MLVYICENNKGCHDRSTLVVFSTQELAIAFCDQQNMNNWNSNTKYYWNSYEVNSTKSNHPNPALNVPPKGVKQCIPKSQA